nr:MAG TPA: hypothetical protein [Caudoviricetes sp.]
MTSLATPMIAPGGDPHKPRQQGFFASTFGTESAYEDNWRQHAKNQRL